MAVVIAMVLHECAHGYMAKWNGDLTAQYSGRLTLNPLKHFDAFGFMMLMVAGFGYAKPVPVNPHNFRRKRLGFFLVAVAGVTLNLILVFICAFFLALLEKTSGQFFYVSLSSEFAPNVGVYILSNFLYFMMVINANLVIFNLLPIFPLDGHRILESATGPLNRVTKFLRDFGPYILIGLVLLGALSRLMAEKVNWYPAYLDPLGFLLETVGGGIRDCFINLWRFVFGVPPLWGVPW